MPTASSPRTRRVTAKLLAHIGAKAPMTRYDDHTQRSRTRADRGAARRASDRAGQRRRDAADLRSRLQAGTRRSRRRTSGAHDPGTVGGDRRTDTGRPADRPLLLPWVPARQSQGARRTRSTRSPPFARPLSSTKPGRGLALRSPLLAEKLGDREAAVAREISKLHEECVTGTLAQLAERYTQAAPRARS